MSAFVAIKHQKPDIHNTRIIYCLSTVSQCLCGATEYIHFYETAESRDRGLRYWQREDKFANELHFTFEIPIDFYLEKAMEYL